MESMIRKLINVSLSEEGVEKEKTFTEGVEEGIRGEEKIFNPLGK